MKIRRGTRSDMQGLNRLLEQVLMVHHEGRPDLFQSQGKKYTDEQLQAILEAEETPVYVAVDEEEQVLGYAFCQYVQHVEDHVLTDIKTLYIDDLCVDESCRGRQIGTALYEHVLQVAKGHGCYNVTLNVWACNTQAQAFYEHCGMVPQKIGMETILRES